MKHKEMKPLRKLGGFYRTTQPMRIFGKLLIAFLAFIIIPGVIASSVIYYNAKNMIEREIFSKLTAVATEKATEIETSLQQKFGDLEILERLNVYQTIFPVLDRFSNERSNPAYVDAKNEIDRRFVMFEHALEYADIMLANMDGKIIYTLNPGRDPEVGTIVPDEDAIFQKVKTGMYVGGIRETNYHKESTYSMPLAGPLYDDAGKLIGLVIVEVDVGALYKLLQDNPGLGESWETLLVKKTPDNTVAFISPLRHAPEAGLNKTIPMGSIEALPAQAAARGESGSGFSGDYRGKDVLAAWQPIPSMGWGLIAKIDQEEADAPIEALWKLLIIIILATLFLAILAAYAMARSIADPILRLKKGVELVGSGNLDYKVATVAKDEVGALSRAFDAMTDYLKKTTTSIYLLNEENTARKKAEKKVQDLFENSRDALMTLEPPSWRFTSGNPATIRMFGVQDEADFISHRPWELSPTLQPDGRVSAEKALEMIEIATREGSHFYEWTHRRVNGEEFFADVLLTQVEWKGKGILQATVRDITERKLAETYQEIGLKVLQILNAPGDLQDAIQYCIAVLKARTDSDAVGIRLQEGEDFPWDKEGKACLECTCGLVISGKTDPANPFFTMGGSFWTNDSAQLLTISPDQELRFHPCNRCITAGYASIALVPIWSRGKIVGVVQINDKRKGHFTLGAIEILEEIASHIGETLVRKQLEESLARLHQRNELILRSAGEGILGLDLEGKHTFVNPTAARMLGYTAEELIGQLSHSLWHHTKADGTPCPREVCNIYAAYHDGVTHSSSAEVFWRKDGTRFSVEYTSTPIYENDQLTGAVVTFTDITARIQAQTERERLADQLRIAQKLEAIGLLTSGIAHDFNNLLSVISGFCELSLLDMKDDDPLRENLLEIQGAGEHAAALTRQLLAFSRSQVLKLEVLNLNDIFGHMDRILRRLVREDINLAITLSPDLGCVKADPSQMEQVILNLVLNARDAMPQRGKLTLETQNVALDQEYVKRHPGVQPGSYVMLAVSDTGIGMDAPTKAHLFEPFFTTKARGKGTGLGLSTVYRIVKQSGGHISVYSEQGHGTCCKVYLPQVDETAKMISLQELPVSTSSGSETILVAEDEKRLRKLVCRILRNKGYAVLEASSGDEALQLSDSHDGPIALLLTDVIMPKLNGRETAERLILKRPDTKILYMSGYTENVIFHHGILEEGINLIQKPFTPEALLLRVRKVLDRASK